MKAMFYAVVLTAAPSLVNAQVNEVNVFAKQEDNDATYVLKERSGSGSDFTKFVNNISSLRGSNRSRFLQIRGVGERSDYTPLVRKSVAVFIDDIDYSHYPQAANGNTESLRRVDFGPTHVDRIAGAIYYETNNSNTIGLGISDEKSINGKIHGKKKLGQQTLGYSFAKNLGEGFYDNRTTGDKENNRDESFVRLNLEGANYRQDFHYTKLDNGYDAFSLDNNFQTASRRPGKDALELLVTRTRLNSADKVWQTWLEYLKANTTYSYDEDWNDYSFYDYDIEFKKKRDKFEWGGLYTKGALQAKVRLSQVKESQSEIGFNTGVVRKDIQGDVKRRMIESQLTYKKGGFLFNAGIGRVLQEYGNNQDFYNKRNDNLTLFRIEYKKNDHLLALSQGSKSGGFSTESSIPENRKTYGKEQLYLLEYTLKKEITKSFNLRLTPFYMYRKDAQVSTSYQDNPNDPSSFTFYIDNVADSRAYGFESNFTWKPTFSFVVYTSLSVMNAKYSDYVNDGSPVGDRELPYTPEYQALVKASYYVTDDFSTSIRFNQMDNYYFSNSHGQRSNSFSTVDLEGKYTVGNMSYTLFINNVFDTDYATRGYYFGNRPPSYDKELFTQRGDPRVIGLNFEYQY